MRLGFAVAIHVEPRCPAGRRGPRGRRRGASRTSASTSSRSSAAAAGPSSSSRIRSTWSSALRRSALAGRGACPLARRSEARRWRLPHQGRRGEGRLLAETTAKAVDEAGRGWGWSEQDGHEVAGWAGPAQERGQAGRAGTPCPIPRPTCIKRSKDAGAHVRWKSRTSPCWTLLGQQSFVFHSGDRGVHPAEGPGRARRSTRLRVRDRPVQRLTASVATGRTPISREMDPEQLAGDAEATFSIDSLDLIEGTYKLDVAGTQARRLPLSTPPSALHLPE